MTAIARALSSNNLYFLIAVIFNIQIYEKRLTNQPLPATKNTIIYH